MILALPVLAPNHSVCFEDGQGLRDRTWREPSFLGQPFDARPAFVVSVDVLHESQERHALARLVLLLFPGPGRSP